MLLGGSNLILDQNSDGAGCCLRCRRRRFEVALQCGGFLERESSPVLSSGLMCQKNHASDISKAERIVSKSWWKWKVCQMAATSEVSPCLRNDHNKSNIFLKESTIWKWSMLYVPNRHVAFEAVCSKLKTLTIFDQVEI